MTPSSHSASTGHPCTATVPKDEPSQRNTNGVTFNTPAGISSCALSNGLPRVSPSGSARGNGQAGEAAL